MKNIFDFELKQGTNFIFSLLPKNQDGSNFDLTGLSARMQVRESYTSEEISINLISPTDINIDIVNSKITVNILPAKTIGLKNLKKNYVYDLEIFDSLDITNVKRIIQGSITLDPEVTR